MDNHARFQAVCVGTYNGFVDGQICFTGAFRDETKQSRGMIMPRLCFI
jgi:hypothetical protein